MADLEESIFQRNVPGRYSKWDREEGVEDEEEFDPTDVERLGWIVCNYHLLNLTFEVCW